MPFSTLTASLTRDPIRHIPHWFSQKFDKPALQNTPPHATPSPKTRTSSSLSPDLSGLFSGLSDLSMGEWVPPIPPQMVGLQNVKIEGSKNKTRRSADKRDQNRIQPSSQTQPLKASLLLSHPENPFGPVAPCFGVSALTADPVLPLPPSAPALALAPQASLGRRPSSASPACPPQRTRGRSHGRDTVPHDP